MIKRILAVLMILIIVISLSGCTKDNKEGNDSNTSKVNSSAASKVNKEENMGRYMEKDIELPKLNGQETIIRVLQNAQNKFEAYSQSQSDGKIYCYTQKEDNTWEKSEPGWLNTEKILKMKLQIMDICYGEDANYYACYQDYSKNCGSVLVKASADGKAGELMEMPYLTKVETVVNNTEYCPMITKIGVLKSGNIIISNQWSQDKLIILSAEGKKVDSLETTDMQNFLVVDNHIIVTDKDSKVCLYNTETKSNDQSITYEDKNKNADDMFATPNRAYAIKEDGTLFIADSDGIHRMNQNGSLWETTVDGALNSMNMPSLMITGLYVTEGDQKEEYYVIFSDDTAGYQLKQYVFDKTVPTIPKKEITVYSLKENKTIRQAIALFQSQNADVKINYMVAMGEEEGNVTDYIRALNTELLSGKGADVILLDGLPIDSYIEKGVLADISELAEGINKDGNILPNIYENYNAQGKVYRLPIRFNVPMILGKQEVVDASNNLTDMVNYIKQSGKQFYDKATYQMLLKDNLALYYKDLCTDGMLQQDKLKEFLANVKTISDNCKATETLDQYTATGYSNGKVLFISDDLFRMNYFSIGTYEAGTMQLGDVYGLMIPHELAKERKLKYSIMNRHYIPKGLVGLNKASKETDIAKDFINFLFTSEVQDTNLYDGLPVNTTSLTKWFDQENPGITMGTSDSKGNMIVAYWPSKTVRADLLNEIKGVNAPIEINQVLFNMIIESAKAYLAGEADIDQVTSEIMSKVNTYLAE